MVDKFDRIVLGVPELQVAIAQFQQLFGCAPFTHGTPDGAPAAWWGLSNTVIELVRVNMHEACVRGIVFSSPDAGRDERPVSNALGLNIRLCDGTATAGFRQRQPQAQCAGLSVDHLVLRTDDAQACIDLFTRELGVRLALDKTVPQWGGRMLFFRAGKLTLEVMESDKDPEDDTLFWGLAFQHRNLSELVGQLGARGVSVSGIREGRKPGTLVATVKSHCLGIPTLLIQPTK